jgi:hypothetical protein
MTRASRRMKAWLYAVLLLGIWPAAACSLSLEDYRIADPDAAGAGGAASAIDMSGSDASAGMEGAASPTSLDNEGLGGSAGATSSGGGTGGSGVVPPPAAPPSWDSPDTLWDTATWN